MPSLLEVGPPSVEPVSSAEAINWIKQPTGTPDAALIGILITAARRYIESQTGLTLASRSFVQYEERFPYTAWPAYFDQSRAPVVNNHRDHRLWLLRSPLTAVEKVIYVGTDGKLHALLPGTHFVVDYARRPGSIAPLPSQVWPALLPAQAIPELFWLTESWMPALSGLNRVQIFFTAGFTPNASDLTTVSLGAEWQPATAYAQFSYFIDENGNLQVQMNAASGSPLANKISGIDPPTLAAVGASATDGTCSWFNAGLIANIAAYQTGHVYPGPSIVLDSNGNIEFTQAGLTSGSPEPTWSAVGQSTLDNGGTWINLGAQRAAGPAPPNQLVEYQSGTGIPEDLKTAILMILAHMYYNREPVADGRIADVPHSVTAICNNYRVWTV